MAQTSIDKWNLETFDTCLLYTSILEMLQFSLPLETDTILTNQAFEPIVGIIVVEGTDILACKMCIRDSGKRGTGNRPLGGFHLWRKTIADIE